MEIHVPRFLLLNHRIINELGRFDILSIVLHSGVYAVC